MKEEFDFLKEIVKDYNDYRNESVGNLTEIESICLSIHNAGDVNFIYSKMWGGKELLSEERDFVRLLNSGLDKVDSADRKVIYRYEMNITEEEINNLKSKLSSCFLSQKLYTNPSFWNFSEEDWKFENFLLQVMTSNKSSAKIVYPLYGLEGLNEKEIIIKPKTIFEVIEFTDSMAVLKELN